MSYPFIETNEQTHLFDKVPDYVIAIPEGVKKAIWFTNLEGNKKCIIHSLNSTVHDEIIDVTFYSDIFKGKGSLLYGTVFNINELRIFAIEDIFYFAGDCVKDQPFSQKLDIMFHMLSTSKRIRMKSITFGIPPIHKSLFELRSRLTTGLTRYAIQNFQFVVNNRYSSVPYFEREAIFQIKKHVGVYKSTSGEQIHISDVNTTQFMTSLLVTSSDHVSMICYYNAKFQMWEPLLLE